MSKIALGLLREIHWALVPIFIPVGPARIRWTLGLTLVALAYYTWAGNPGLSELPGIAIFAYTAGPWASASATTGSWRATPPPQPWASPWPWQGISFAQARREGFHQAKLLGVLSPEVGTVGTLWGKCPPGRHKSVPTFSRRTHCDGDYIYAGRSSTGLLSGFEGAMMG